MSQSYQESCDNSETRQDGSRALLASKLESYEKRLREIVAKYEHDPDKILLQSLTDVKEVISNIYLALREDAESQDGVLARRADIWESLKKVYAQTHMAAGKLRPIFEKFNRITSNREREPAADELDDTTDRMIDRRQQWLAKITEFQQVFSAFYREIARAEETSAESLSSGRLGVEQFWIPHGYLLPELLQYI
jgi:hypothetical protein